jgi:hypothetical protein
MMTSVKSLVLVGVLGMSVAPAFAETKAPVTTKKPNCGESFDVFAGAHRTATPRAEMKQEVLAKPRTLTDSQVAWVVNSRLDDVEYCWMKLPATKRVDTTAMFKFSVAPNGSVGNVELADGVPAEAQKCMVQLASQWTFPTTEAQSEVEYPVALRSKVAVRH